MGKLQVQIILEILGRPPENVKDALNQLIEKLDSEKGIKVLNKTVHKPKPIEQVKDLYTAFADITLELDTLDNYFGILFAYMPSHVELVEPERIELSNFELSELANKLTQRLHSYDAITKKMITERDILLKKLQEIAPELFKQAPEGRTNLEAMAKPKKKKAKKSKPKKKTKKK